MPMPASAQEYFEKIKNHLFKSVYSQIKRDEILVNLINSELTHDEKLNALNVTDTFQTSFGMALAVYSSSKICQQHIKFMNVLLDQGTSAEKILAHLTKVNHLKQSLIYYWVDNQDQNTVFDLISLLKKLNTLGISRDHLIRSLKMNSDNNNHYVFFDLLDKHNARFDSKTIKTVLKMYDLLPNDHPNDIHNKNELWKILESLPNDQRIVGLLQATASCSPSHEFFDIMNKQRGFKIPSHERGYLKKCLDELNLTILKHCMGEAATPKIVAEFVELNEKDKRSAGTYLASCADSRYIENFIELLINLVTQHPDIATQIGWLLQRSDIHGGTIGMTLANHQNSTLNIKFLKLLRHLNSSGLSANNVFSIINQANIFNSTTGHAIAQYQSSDSLSDYFLLLIQLHRNNVPADLIIKQLNSVIRACGWTIGMQTAKCHDITTILQYLDLLTALNKSLLANKFIQNMMAFETAKKDSFLNSLDINMSPDNKVIILNKMIVGELLPESMAEQVYNYVLKLPEKERYGIFTQAVITKNSSMQENPWHTYLKKYKKMDILSRIDRELGRIEQKLIDESRVVVAATPLTYPDYHPEYARLAPSAPPHDQSVTPTIPRLYPQLSAYGIQSAEMEITTQIPAVMPTITTFTSVADEVTEKEIEAINTTTSQKWYDNFMASITSTPTVTDDEQKMQDKINAIKMVIQQNVTSVKDNQVDNAVLTPTNVPDIIEHKKELTDEELLKMAPPVPTSSLQMNSIFSPKIQRKNEASEMRNERTAVYA